MTIHHQSQKERIEAGLGFEWDLLPATITRTSDIPSKTSHLNFKRVGDSHKGIGNCDGLHTLWATSVNQDFLEEICLIKTLDTLYLSGVTAQDLYAVNTLPKLRRLLVVGASKLKDLAWLPTQRSLKYLAIENLKLVHDLSPLSQLVQLQSLAVEGSMWTPMRVSCLKPLSNLTLLKALFITNLRVEDHSLQPLHTLDQLELLQCARFFPHAEFMRLSAAQPKLNCSWFEAENWKAT
ncbi:hypothetical protein [Pseudomonas sp. PL-6]